MKQYLGCDRKIAIVGATGNVGRLTLQLLLQRGVVPKESIITFASAASAGQTLEILGTSFVLQELKEDTLAQASLWGFNTEAEVSQQWVPKILSVGGRVADSSSYYRQDPKVPLIVGPVNLADAKDARLCALANCISSPLMCVLKPLMPLGIKVLRISTFQSTSGAGKRAMEGFLQETKLFMGAMDGCVESAKALGSMPFYLGRPIAFNVLPQVGEFDAQGYCSEENKILSEIQKVLDGKLKISVTTVRVPVLVGHCSDFTIQFQEDVGLNQVRSLLEGNSFLKVSDDIVAPQEVVGKEQVFISRLRTVKGFSEEIKMWVASDNLRRGAALDTVEVLEYLWKQY